MNQYVRPLRESDKTQLLDLFCKTINEVNLGDYTKEQVQLWGSRDRVEKNWDSSFDGKYVFVFDNAGKPLGFCELREDWYIDRFYIDSESIGEGIGKSLYNSLENKAIELKIDELLVDASITAKPFFMKMGFEVINEQKVFINEVEFTNFRMSKDLRGI